MYIVKIKYNVLSDSEKAFVSSVLSNYTIKNADCTELYIDDEIQFQNVMVILTRLTKSAFVECHSIEYKRGNINRKSR